MMGHKICFYEEILIIIPKLSLLLLLIWSPAKYLNQSCMKFCYKTGLTFFPSKNNPKNEDPSYMTDLDFFLDTLMCLSIGTPKNNKFSICPKWKIHYFQVSQKLGRVQPHYNLFEYWDT